MATYFEDLQAQVALTVTVEASAVALIQGLVAKLEAAQGDPAQLQSIVAQLKASSDGLAAAITANTPGGPPAPAAPAPTDPAANPGDAGAGDGQG